MKPSLAGVSLILFGVSVILLIAWTAFEHTLVGMSMSTERILTFLLLVLPAGIGAVLGAMSLLRKEGRTWMAATGILLNILFAFFHATLLLFAG